MGAEGGNARNERLSPEERKRIASDASKVRWERVRKAKEEAIRAAAVPKEATPAPQAARKRSSRPMPKAFKGASSYAEKRLAEALRERGEYMGRVAALNAEIPSLVSVIRALGGNANIPPAFSQAYPAGDPIYQPGPVPMVDPLASVPNIDPALFAANAAPVSGLAPATAQMPLVPRMAGGGATDLDFQPTEEEGPPLPKMGGGWQ